jgi:hypothetical protein
MRSRDAPPPRRPGSSSRRTKEWYRDWAISKILIETLEDMDPRYPPKDLNVPARLKRLAAE